MSPQGVKPVKLVGVCGATFAPGRDERRICIDNSYKTGRRDLYTDRLQILGRDEKMSANYEAGLELAAMLP